MLDRAHAEAIIPVSDRKRSTEYYVATLGLSLLEDTALDVRLEAGNGTTVALYESVGAGKSRHTLAVFYVDDVDAAVQQLRDNGVVFEDYDLPDLRTVNAVARVGDERAAWFKDPDGNILAVATRDGG